MPDPYHVWLSEIMLQQTTVAAVSRYFLQFITTWPSVADLAAAPLDDVLRAWAGLGYYARARNLHACARSVVDDHGGRFPASESALLKLPGIGPYTAAAIAAIAFGQRAAAVDGNVERVISRFHAIETPLPGAKPEIRARTLAMVPAAGAGDFAQALMDLGATICTPRRPRCPDCPWADHCTARQLGIADTLPRKAPRKPLPVRRGIAFWIERSDGAVLLRRRPDKGLLGGMMEVPSTDWRPQLPDDPAPPLAAEWRKGPKVAHTFTHFHLELDVWRTHVATETAPVAGGNWVAMGDLHAEALPSLMRKIVTVITKNPVVKNPEKQNSP